MKNKKKRILSIFLLAVMLMTTVSSFFNVANAAEANPYESFSNTDNSYGANITKSASWDGDPAAGNYDATITMTHSVRNFNPPNKTLNLVVILDVSGSMAGCQYTSNHFSLKANPALKDGTVTTTSQLFAIGGAHEPNWGITCSKAGLYPGANKNFNGSEVYRIYVTNGDYYGGSENYWYIVPKKSGTFAMSPENFLYCRNDDNNGETEPGTNLHFEGTRKGIIKRRIGFNPNGTGDMYFAMKGANNSGRDSWHGAASVKGADTPNLEAFYNSGGCDSCFGNQTPSFMQARQASIDFINAAKNANSSSKITVIPFSGYADTSRIFTANGKSDSAVESYVTELYRSLGFGTNYADATGTALSELNKMSGGEKHVVWMTDGANSPIPHTSIISNNDQTYINTNSIKKIATLHCVGFGKADEFVEFQRYPTSASTYYEGSSDLSALYSAVSSNVGIPVYTLTDTVSEYFDIIDSGDKTVKYNFTCDGVTRTTTIKIRLKEEYQQVKELTYYPTNVMTPTKDEAAYLNYYGKKLTVQSPQLPVGPGDGTTGAAKLVKTSEDGIVSGMKFNISGGDTNQTMTTNSKGEISLSDLPIFEMVEGEDEETGEPIEVPGDKITYTASEVNTPIRYVIPQSQSFQLDENTSVKIEFENRLKKWRVSVTKQDAEYPTRPQGNASLANAKYGIYKDGSLLDTYATNASGQFTTRYYVCGTGYTLREISPSEGYLINPAAESVGMTPEATTIEYNNTSKTVKEQVIKGWISVVKHTDTGDTGIDTPEVGAQFEVYLTSSGSYNNAYATERDIITINEHGYGETKKLPYGWYTVHQISGWAGSEYTNDFVVYIAEDGKQYSFILNNKPVTMIQIIKRDAETGKAIPASGIGFKIYNVQTGKPVVMHLTYPTPMDISEFYTDTTGRLMLPDSLTMGDYDLVELHAAYGYVVEGNPVRFKVDGTTTLVTVDVYNTPQKGKIYLEKTGEVFKSAVKTDDIWQPVYEAQGIPDTEYYVYADETIKTPDGTTRFVKDEVVDILVTDSEGKADSIYLYLGKYRVEEKTAAYSMVRNPAVHYLEFSYTNQEVAYIEERISFENDRQKAVFEVIKELEQDETYHIGMNTEFQNVEFSLYAAEDIKAQDGTVIPKDGLIEANTIKGNFKLEFRSDLPIGKYYTKETATDEHYIQLTAKYPLDFKYGDQNVQVQTIATNDGEAIKNKLIRGNVKIKKIDEDFENVANVTFGIFSADTTVFNENTALTTMITDENGEATFTGVPKGNWKVAELSSPVQYIPNTDIYDVVIGKNLQNVQLTVKNFYKTGNVALKKIDAIATTETLEGVEFAIYSDTNGNGDFDPEDAFIADLYDRDNGDYGYDCLRYGNYFLVETVTLPHYILDKAAYYFEIREHGATVEITNSENGFANTPMTGSLKIVKTSDDDVIEGRKFTVSGESYTGHKYNKTFVTDENGEIFTPRMRIGNYTVSEVFEQGMEKYILPDDKEIEIKHDKTTEITMHNTVIVGDIYGRKIGEGGQYLKDAVIGLFEFGTKNYTADTALRTVKTDKDGNFSFTKVPYGIYAIREIEAPTGFKVNETPIFVTISKLGQRYDVVIFDDYDKLLIKGVKLCESGDYLEGVLIGLFHSDEKAFLKENAIRTIYTDDKGEFTFKDVFFGDYIVREIQGLSGYIPNFEEYPVSVEYGKDTPFVKIVNQYTKLEITVVDKDTQKPIVGVEVIVKDKDGNVIDEFVSDGDPHVIDKIPVDTEITIAEKHPPKGYEPAEYIEYTIKPTGMKQEVVLENTKIGSKTTPAPTTKPSGNNTTGKGSTGKTPWYVSPQTGDGINPVLLWIIIGIAGAGFVASLVFAIKAKRKKNDDDE